MKKSIKIGVGCIFFTLVLVFVLMFVGILPNVFLDRSNLICSRIYIENAQMKQEDYVEFTFDNRAIVKDGNKKSEIIYYDESLIQSSYEELKKMEQEKNIVELKENVIILSSSVEINKEDKVKRKIMKKKYQEFGYACK